jgi:PII-like signaling protein
VTELLKLSTYFGERDRVDGELLADELFALYTDARTGFSAMLRGVEGFGHHHSTHTELLLTMSEDLPIVSMAIDTPERIEALVPRVLAIKRRGLVTVERARWLGEPIQPDEVSRDSLPADLREQAKLMLILGRGDRALGKAAFVTACEILQRHGAAGASVLLGVDGTLNGQRVRAQLLTRNPKLPVLVVAVGARESIASAAAELKRVLGEPLMAVERVQICRRDGRALAEPELVPPALEHDLVWGQMLTVYSSEDYRVDGDPLHRVLVRRLRRERLAGATTLRGVWGFHDDQAPQGDRFWQLRRHAPLMTIVIDTHERIAEIYGVVEEITAHDGLVTVEAIPVCVLPGA